MSKTPVDKAAMTITVDRPLIEWVTETAKAAGVSRNVLMAEILAMHHFLHAAGFVWVRDRRLSFNALQKRPEDGYSAGMTIEFGESENASTTSKP